MHLSAGGLYDGLVLLNDDETGTYWDHITGEGRHGPLAGKTMENWGTPITTVGQARQTTPELQVLNSRPTGFKSWLFGVITRMAMRGRGVLPPTFRRTMGEKDGRLNEHTHGLGVIAGTSARFYPLAALKQPVEEPFAGRNLRVEVASDGIPAASWADGGPAPMQIFLRWYGFSYTYPRCEIGPTDAHSGS